MRRVTAAVSVVLLMIVAAAVAEASLLGLLLVFATILQLSVALDIAGHYVQMVPVNVPSFLQVAIANAGTVGSYLLTLGCGMGAGVYRYRRWRPIS